MTLKPNMMRKQKRFIMLAVLAFSFALNKVVFAVSGSGESGEPHVPHQIILEYDTPTEANGSTIHSEQIDAVKSIQTHCVPLNWTQGVPSHSVYEEIVSRMVAENLSEQQVLERIFDDVYAQKLIDRPNLDQAVIAARRTAFLNSGFRPARAIVVNLDDSQGDLTEQAIAILEDGSCLQDSEFPMTIRSVTANTLLSLNACPGEPGNPEDPDARYIPNDPDLCNQYAFDNYGQRFRSTLPPGTLDVDINLPEAWHVTRGLNDMIVAILDTGMDTGLNATHPDLPDNVLGWDFIENDNNPQDTDPNSHGTFVAGIVGALTNNTNGMTGVCPNCRLMVLRIAENSNPNSVNLNIARAAIQYAVVHGADVINMSFGTTENNSGLASDINAASAFGAILVASAGNNNSSTPVYPAAYDPVIAVGATNSNDCRWVNSNYGPWVDIAAPGADIRSTIIYSRNPSLPYGWWNGTSFAAPQVAGTAALILSRNYNLDSNTVRSLLASGSTSFICDFGEALGSGRLNASGSLFFLNESPSLILSSSTLDVYPGQTVQIQAIATDPDNDVIHLQVLNPPAGSIFVDYGNGSGNFTWHIPLEGAQGIYQFGFGADDDYLGMEVGVIITVHQVPNPPHDVPETARPSRRPTVPSGEPSVVIIDP